MTRNNIVFDTGNMKRQALEFKWLLDTELSNKLELLQKCFKVHYILHLHVLSLCTILGVRGEVFCGSESYFRYAYLHVRGVVYNVLVSW